MTPRAIGVAATLEARVDAAWQARAARPGHRAPAASFGGRRVLTLESRRSPELALLVVNYGGRPMIAPALREVALEADTDHEAFIPALLRREFDIVVLTTGVGTRLLLRQAALNGGADDLIRALAATRIVARGPKPVAALREVGVVPWLTAPSPNTWREILAVIDGGAAGACAGAAVAVQEYGMSNPDLLAALTERGARVRSVPVYRWEMPADLGPLRAAARAVAAGAIDVVVLTASVQLVHLLAVAIDLGIGADVTRELRRLVIASIGPMTSDELRRQGLPIDLEPARPKMGFLVKEAAERCSELLQAKRPTQW